MLSTWSDPFTARAIEIPAADKVPRSDIIYQLEKKLSPGDSNFHADRLERETGRSLTRNMAQNSNMNKN
jgi:hypothetical protein